MASLWTFVSKNRALQRIWHFIFVLSPAILMSLMETLKILAWSVLGRLRNTTAWHGRVTPRMRRIVLLMTKYFSPLFKQKKKPIDNIAILS